MDTQTDAQTQVLEASVIPTVSLLGLLGKLDPEGLTTSQIALRFSMTTEAANAQLCELEERGLVFFADVEGFWHITKKGAQRLST